MPENELFVPCTIRRGGFSSERTFELKLPSGEKLVGLSYVEYLRDQNWDALDKDTPASGQTIEGFVQCRIVQQVDQDSVLIEVPSSDVIRYPANTLAAAG